MKKIKIVFTVLLLLLSFILTGQNNMSFVDGDGFKSVFQDIESGNFEGSVNGLLIIRNTKGKKMLLDFQGSQGKLVVEKDKYEVYDVSSKNYTGSTTSGKTEVKYQTYGSANSLGITLNGSYYELSSIDGACDLVINGLEYFYESEKTSEYLIIKITKEIELLGTFNSIKVLPNSTLVFAIKRK